MKKNDRLDAISRKLDQDNLLLHHELVRLGSELKFAAKFKDLYPARTAAWSTLIDRANGLLEALPEPIALESLRGVVRRAEQILAPIAVEARKYTIHCVGHAHIDMNWMWSWPETVAIVNDTFATVLKLMDQYPAFKFSQSQASVYAIVEEFNPGMLERIKQRVREKRWEVTASHWVECDKNMCGGESLCRHLLHTRAYMRKLFGLAPGDVPVDWAPDTFGHAATVPTYLALGGVKYLYLHRPGSFGPRKPAAFWWRGPDGARVLVKNDVGFGYNGRVNPDMAFNLLDFARETGGRSCLFVYGVGDHGGGPTRCDLLKIMEMSSWPVFPAIRFSTASDFFKALEREASSLPVIEGELNTEFTGCYTSQSLIKKSNRIVENRLLDAEFAALLAWAALKQPYPGQRLRESWTSGLFNHFHDILPGSGVRDTLHYAMGLSQTIMARTGMIETLALRALAARVDTSAGANLCPPVPQSPPVFYRDALGAGAGIGAGQGLASRAEQSIGSGARPFVVFNPTASERKELVEATLWDNPAPRSSITLKNKTFAVLSPAGSIIPAQVIATGTRWGHEYATVLFPVEVPGFGYAMYTMVENQAPQHASKLSLLQPSYHCRYSSWEKAGRFGCENEHILLEISPRTGGIMRLRDKRTGRDIIGNTGELPLLEYTVERPRHMTSWLIEFSNRSIPVEVRSVSVAESGPYRVAIKVEAVAGASRFTVVYSVEEDSPRVAIDFSCAWLPDFSTYSDGCPNLRMPFAFNMEKVRASYEIPFGSIERNLKNDEEVPALQWARLDGRSRGVPLGCLLVNDCKHGHALDGNVLRISLIRGSKDPDPVPEVGEHTARLALYPFSGSLGAAASSRLAQHFNRPLRVVGTDVHAGTLAARGQFVRIDERNVVVSCLKKAEDDDSLIVRLYEMQGRNALVRVSFDPAFGRVSRAYLVDLMETPAGGRRLTATSRSVAIPVPARKIVAARVWFKPTEGGKDD